MARQRGSFRVAANSAKERLSEGFWEQEREKLSRVLDQAHAKGVDETTAKEFYRNRLNAHFVQADDSMEQLYERVVAVLRADPSAIPLAQMLDRDHMRTLTERDRDRYVFNLSAKVQECIARYNREKDMIS